MYRKLNEIVKQTFLSVRLRFLSHHTQAHIQFVMNGGAKTQSVYVWRNRNSINRPPLEKSLDTPGKYNT